MKNILRTIFIFVVGALFLVSCEKKETNFDAMTKDWDPNNTTYYVQFVDATQSAETGVALDGGFVEITTTISVALIGNPQANATTVALGIDASSTMTPDMYTISGGLNLTIPAGETSASVTITSVAENMPVGVPVVLNLSINDPNAAPTGTEATYTFKRIEFCPLVNGPADLIGTWTGSDAYYGSGFVATNATATTIDIDGIGQDFIADWWGEPVVGGGKITIEIAGNGLITVPRQYLYTTIWGGSNYDYEIAGDGKWTNCGASPTMKIEYDIFYPGDAEGLAQTYSSYFSGIPYFTADVTLGGSSLKKGTIEITPIVR